MKELELQLVTIEKKIFDEKVEAVYLPTQMGEIGILPNHVSLVTNLAEGEIKIEKNKETLYVVCTGGFAQVSPDKVLVLTDAAEHAEEIDIEKAEEAKKRAEETMRKKGLAEPQYQEAALALRRSLLQIKVASRRTRRRVASRPESRV